MGNTYYAVGYIVGNDDIDFSSLKFFEKESEAEQYYIAKLTEFGFKVADVLAVFKVENNRITAVSRLRSYNYEIDKGPVGPVSGIESV